MRQRNSANSASHRLVSPKAIRYFPASLPTIQTHSAVVAELADALDSGSSGVTPVEVQVLSAAIDWRKDLGQIASSPFSLRSSERGKLGFAS